MTGNALDTVRAEHLLGEHAYPTKLLQGTTLDYSDIGRIISSKGLESKNVSLQRRGLSPDAATKAGRKAVIKSAKLLSKFSDKVHKPNTFALAYLKGYFDRQPEEVIRVMREEWLKNPIDRLEQVTVVCKNRVKFGNPSGDHMSVYRLSASPVTYGISISVRGVEVCNRTVVPKETTTSSLWYT